MNKLQELEAILEGWKNDLESGCGAEPTNVVLSEILALDDWIPVTSEEKPEDQELILIGAYLSNSNFAWTDFVYDEEYGFPEDTEYWQRITGPQE